MIWRSSVFEDRSCPYDGGGVIDLILIWSWGQHESSPWWRCYWSYIDMIMGTAYESSPWWRCYWSYIDMIMGTAYESSPWCRRRLLGGPGTWLAAGWSWRRHLDWRPCRHPTTSPEETHAYDEIQHNTEYNYIQMYMLIGPLEHLYIGKLPTKYDRNRKCFQVALYVTATSLHYK